MVSRTPVEEDGRQGRSTDFFLGMLNEPNHT